MTLVAQLLQPKSWCCIFEHEGQMRHGTSDAPKKAAERIKALEAENRRLREALEYVSCQNGRGPDGFIDWQRCVDRIQNVTRAALGEPKQEQSEYDCEYCGWTRGCGREGCRVCDHGYYG